jgi:thermolysin
VERKAALFLERAFVDAATGELLFHHSLIQVEDPLIGTGTGVRNDQLKFPTTLQNDGKYYMWDAAKVRPINQRTYEANHQFGSTIYLGSSADNTWAKNSIVNAHTYVGLIYDFYFIVFGNKGVDNTNTFAINSFVHIYDVGGELTDNAFFMGENVLYGPGFYFLDPYYGNKDYAASLDVVAHEFSHGVTHFTGANLTYYGEPGALNESFSDIMGTSVEFYFQPEGTGYNMSDWINGEDAGPTFTYDKCRRQDNPNLNSQMKNAGAPSSYWYPDPCHISQKVPTLYSGNEVLDYDNVHINCTIFPHLFYLLAHGGTNPVSGVGVTGIGLEKAQKIIWQAFVKHMTAGTNFLGAANAILQSAIELHGASSTEVAQTKNAIRAIGYTVN